MEVITFLIPLAILIAAFFVGSFIWMTLHGQYDDLETPAMRMLIDDEKLNNKISKLTNKDKKCTQMKL